MRKTESNFLENFTSLHNRLYGKVFSFVRLRIKDPEEVKDIVQDVFLKAYNSWKDSQTGLPDEQSAKNFLYIMARQRMIDIWRSARSRLQTELSNEFEEDEEFGGNNFDQLASSDPLPEEMFEKNESRSEMLTVLNTLRKEEREILVLRFLEEMEYKELARLYDTSENNIRQKVSRSLQNLKKAFAKIKENQKVD